MSTTPFTQHTSNMFADRGTNIDDAVEYAHSLLETLTGSDRAAATTALMVVINTAHNAWAAQPTPAQEIAAAWVRDLVAQEIDKHAQGMQDKVSETVSEWLDDHLDDKVDQWVQNSLTFEDQCDYRVERWIENNLDLSDKISDTINDLDLVVRVR